MFYALITFIVLTVILGLGLFFQMKAARGHASEQQQLLNDYQRRVDEQQKLLDDYRALEKNFDSVGEGYEQALLAFDKMEEDTQKLKTANETLEKRCNVLQQQNTQLTEGAQKAGEITAQALGEMRQIAKETGNTKLLALIGKISDVEDINGQNAIVRTDNIMVAQIATEAIAASGIDKITYLKFENSVAEDASYTMLHTNLQKAVRALTHLLDNALKFTTEGSVKLNVSVDMDKMLAIYTVEDTGSGIAAEDAERIFEPYVKLNQYFDGMGVGLTVARNIARRLEGDVTYAPAQTGTGFCFTLTLPI